MRSAKTKYLYTFLNANVDATRARALTAIPDDRQAYILEVDDRVHSDVVDCDARQRLRLQTADRRVVDHHHVVVDQLERLVEHADAHRLGAGDAARAARHVLRRDRELVALFMHQRVGAGAREGVVVAVERRIVRIAGNPAEACSGTRATGIVMDLFIILIIILFLFTWLSCRQRTYVQA